MRRCRTQMPGEPGVKRSSWTDLSAGRPLLPLSGQFGLRIEVLCVWRRVRPLDNCLGKACLATELLVEPGVRFFAPTFLSRSAIPGIEKKVSNDSVANGGPRCSRCSGSTCGALMTRLQAADESGQLDEVFNCAAPLSRTRSRKLRVRSLTDEREHFGCRDNAPLKPARRRYLRVLSAW